MIQEGLFAQILYSQGMAAIQAGRVREALGQWEAAKTLYQQLGFEREIASCDVCIGNALADLGQRQLAIEHYLRAKIVYFRLGSEKDVALCDSNIGIALAALDQPQKAMEHYEQARDVYLRLGFERELAGCDLNIGDALRTIGLPQQAIEYLERARTVFSNLGFEHEVAGCDFNIGNALIDLGQPQQAMERYKQARDIYLRFGLEKDVTDCDRHIGTAYRALGQPQQAMEHYERARAAFSHLGSEKDVAHCDTCMGNALFDLGQPQQAMEHYLRARAMYFRLGFERDVANCDRSIGNALVELGQPQQAIGHHERAMAVYFRLGFEKEVAGCDLSIGTALRSLGQLQQAIEHHERARAIFFRLGFEKDVACCDFNIGNIFVELGLPQQAIEHYKRAKDFYFHLGFAKDMAHCDLNIGNAFIDLGRLQEAMEYCERARDVFFRLGFEKYVASCDVNIGKVLDNLLRPQQAIGYYERARATFSSLGLEREMSHCDGNIGNALVELGQPQQAIERHERARAICSRLGFDKDVALCDYNIGYALTNLAAAADPTPARSKYQQALKYLDDAILTLEKLRANIPVATHRISFFEQFTSSYRTAIRCCLHLGQITKALHFFERSRSKTLAEAVSGNLIPDRSEIGEELYIEFLRLRSRLFDSGFLPLIRSDGGSHAKTEGLGHERGSLPQAQREFDALVDRIATQFPSSAFAQRLKATEVRYLKNVAEYVALLPDSRSCLLEFLSWTDDGKLRAFLVTKQNNLELLTFQEGSLDQLEAVVGRWWEVYGEKLSPGAKANIIEDTCHRLHEVIFNAEVQITREADDESSLSEVGSRRLLDHLDATLEPGDDEHPRRMYLIPHHFLFLLPLHAACWDEQQGEAETTSAKGHEKAHPHYLLEDYVVIYAPSAYLLKVGQEREYPKLQQPRAIVVGNPQPLANAPPLVFAAEEARAVTKQLKEAGWEVDEMIEMEATKQRFLNGDQQGVAGINSGAYDHLHLAQHAGIREQGHQVYFCFGQSSEDHQCYDRDIAGAPLQGMKSVVAAACLTSVTSPALNEYLGMGAAFLQAGVGTFIGTIYPLSDEGSSELVPELYRLRLQEGLSWADALRRAQLQMAGVAASGASRDNRGPTMTAEKMVLLQKPRPASRSDSEPEIPLDHPYHWAAFTISGKE